MSYYQERTVITDTINVVENLVHYVNKDDRLIITILKDEIIRQRDTLAKSGLKFDLTYNYCSSEHNNRLYHRKQYIEHYNRLLFTLNTYLIQLDKVITASDNLKKLQLI